MVVMRSTRQYGWGALLITLSSCLGGQTGQPTAASCDGRGVATDEALSGVTPLQFAAAFAGTHTATLAWETPDPTPHDELTLELRPREPLRAVLDCYDDLSVGTDVVLTTRDHGELARFDAFLRGRAGQLTSARLERTDSFVALDVELFVVEGEVHVAGSLTTRDSALPAPNAIFPAPDLGGGAAGGGG